MNDDLIDPETWEAIVKIANRIKCGHKACKDLKRVILRVEKRTAERNKEACETASIQQD